MEKKETKRKSINLSSENTIQLQNSRIDIDFDTLSSLQLINSKDPKFVFDSHQDSDSIIGGGLSQDFIRFSRESIISSIHNNYIKDVFQMVGTGYSSVRSGVQFTSNHPNNLWGNSVLKYFDKNDIHAIGTSHSIVDSIVRLGSYNSESPWVLSGGDNYKNDISQIRTDRYTGGVLGIQVNSPISQSHWTTPNLNHIDKDFFHNGNNGFSFGDSISQFNAQVSRSFGFISGQNIHQNVTFQIRRSGYLAVDLGFQTVSHISKTHRVDSNLNQFNKGALQIESDGFSIAGPVVPLSSQVSSHPWVVSNQNNFENDVFKIGGFEYSPAVAGVQFNSHIYKSHWAVSGINHFEKGVLPFENAGYSVADSMVGLGSRALRNLWVDSFQDYNNNQVFKVGSVKYANAGSIAGSKSKHFESTLVNPNLCHSEYGMRQAKETEYPWLASNLSSCAVLSGSLMKNCINGANTTRTSIIDYNDKGLFTSVHAFRVYEPLDNYTLATLNNTIESTIQKFKSHNPIQKCSLGFEKGKQITIINIFIVQGDVIGDNHHFGDNNYYLAQ